MTEIVETVAEHIAADLTALRQDLARMAEATSKLIEHQTQAVGSRISEIVGDAHEKVGRTAGQAQGHVWAVGRAAEAGIKRHAVTATLISFGIGISLGLFSRLRSG